MSVKIYILTGGKPEKSTELKLPNRAPLLKADLRKSTFDIPN